MNSETSVYLWCLFLFRRAYGVSFYFEKKAAYILYEEALVATTQLPVSMFVTLHSESATLRPYGVTGTLLFTWWKQICIPSHDKRDSQQQFEF